jgi:hypothetical protein
MSTTETINCGRCAHLWGQAHPGFGVCACRARQDKTNQIRPKVRLDSTCEFAQLSAKFDPHFLPRIRAARNGEIYQETQP